MKGLDQTAEGVNSAASVRQAILHAFHEGSTYAKTIPTGKGNLLLECWGCGQRSFDRTTQYCTRVGKCRKAASSRAWGARVGGGQAVPPLRQPAAPDLLGIKLPPTMREPLAQSVSKASQLVAAEKQNKQTPPKTRGTPASPGETGTLGEAEGAAAYREFLAHCRKICGLTARYKRWPNLSVYCQSVKQPPLPMKGSRMNGSRP